MLELHFEILRRLQYDLPVYYIKSWWLLSRKVIQIESSGSDIRIEILRIQVLDIHVELGLFSTGQLQTLTESSRAVHDQIAVRIGLTIII